MKTLLVIGAHPADVIDLAGGTMANHFKAGHRVVTAIMTDGVNSHTIGEVTYNTRSIKIREFKQATYEVGCRETKRFGYEDEPFMANVVVINDILKYIRWCQPDILVTHHPEEYAHWDHMETGKTVCRALKAAIKRESNSDLGERYWVPMVYFFGVQFRPESNRISGSVVSPNILVDISKTVEDKVRAMMCFKSQGHDNEEKIWERMNSYEKEQGRADGLDYAESFIQYYPLKRGLLEGNDDMGFYGGLIKEKSNNV